VGMRVAKNTAKYISQRWSRLTRCLRRSAIFLEHPLYRLVCHEASRLYEIWSQDSDAISQDLVHPLWLKVQPVFGQLISDGVPIDFLQLPVVRRMFYRVGFSQPQQHELTYLRNTGEEVWNLLRQYRESSIGGPLIDCHELNISTNSLGMLYYFTRILEYNDWSEPGTVVEFGGGYGNLCRVFLDLLSGPLTYIIIDLPEMLALQYVYLRSSSRRYQIVAHTSSPIAIRSGCVNLVPVRWIEDLASTCDLFVSTFALSEAPTAVHDMIIRSRFLGANAIYLVGQHVDAKLWRDLALEPLQSAQCAATDLYSNVQLGPFHFANSWELMAKDRKYETVNLNLQT